MSGRALPTCPFLKQSKTVAWDYLRDAASNEEGAINHSELRVDYGNGGQVRLYGADNPDALRGIYLDGVVLDEYADMDPRLWSEVIRPALADRAAGRCSSARRAGATSSIRPGCARRRIRRTGSR
jgi:hypothetical protein